MRKLFVLSIFVLFTLSLAPFIVNADSRAQFAGCATEEEMMYAAQYEVVGVNGLTFTVSAVGLEDFNPAITVLDSEGEVVVCNTDSEEAAELSGELPKAGEIVASENSARVKVTVPSDERADYTVIVTSEDGTNGEFVLVYEGAEVFPGTDEDEFSAIISEGQAEVGVPFGLYVANLGRPELALDPAVTVSLRDGNFEQTCGKSSSRTLCAGESEDLSGSTLNRYDRDSSQMTGDDAMLFFELSGDTATFDIMVHSYQNTSFGEYTFLIYSGVGYP